MTNEGVFPKIDGDVLYASEANRFAGAGRFLGAGSFVEVNGGTSTTVDVGSVIIGAGSLSRNSHIYLTYQVTRTGGTDTVLRIRMSGAGLGNGTFNLQPPGGVSQGTVDIVTGSPRAGKMFGWEIVASDSTSMNGGVASATTLNNFNTGSAFVIKWEAVFQTTAGSLTMQSYDIQGFRSSLD